MIPRYRSLVDDSARWDGFTFRPDDIVISTPPKCGTTWTQMLCALLDLRRPEFPAPLDEISPWLDMCNRPLDEVRRRSPRRPTAASSRRTRRSTACRSDPRVTYVVVGRDPRDVADLVGPSPRRTWTSSASWRCAPRPWARRPRRSAAADASPPRIRSSGSGPSSPTASLGGRRTSRRCCITSTPAGSAARRAERRPLPLRRLEGRPRGELRAAGRRPRDPVLTGARAGARAGSEPDRMRERARELAPSASRAELEGRAPLLPKRRRRRVARAPLRRRPRRLRGPSRGARGCRPRRLGPRRPACVGRRSR